MLAYKSYSDNELVFLLREGDHAAFTEIYIRYAGRIYNSTYKLLQNRNEVRDIVQEIFISLWNKRSDFVLKTNLAGYLYIAARNKVIKVIAHQQVKSKHFSLFETGMEEGFTITDHSIREKQLAQIIEDEINDLPAKMRHVLNLSRKSYLTHKEIAATLNLSESTVKKQVNNALKILRVRLQGFHLWLIFFFLFFSTP